MNDNTKIIRGGLVCDGTGVPPAAQDILIFGDRIADLGAPGAFDAVSAPVIEAAGQMVAPGFIDAHSHGDSVRFRYPANRTKLLQGVTTEVIGNCGSSASCIPGEAGGQKWNDLAEYAAAVNRTGFSTNTVALCGHNSLRRKVMGNAARKAEPGEIGQMRQLLEEALAAGAAGSTTGLTYFPGKFSDTAELTALSSALKGSFRIHATHMRSEGDTLMEAVEEAVEVANAGSGRLEISHLKTIFPRNFHKIDSLLDRLNRLRADGMDLHADRYPYVYSSTRIGQILPPPYDRDPDLGTKLRSSESFRAEVTEALKSSPRDLPTTILMAKGKTLAEIAAENGWTVEAAGLQALLENPEQNAAYLCMSADNMKRILAQEWVCAGSDGLTMPLDDPNAGGHPRSVGTFPTFFRMVSGMTSVQEAVRRMTSLPAEIFRIAERGTIRKGYFADLVLFDPAKYDSAAGFDGGNPMPSGVACVIVNGQTAWTAAEPEKTGRYGRFLPAD